MNEQMKVLIGYDGSSCADGALLDLRRAGLPQTVEVVVMCVADVLMPPQMPPGPGIDEPLFPPALPEAARKAWDPGAARHQGGRGIGEAGRRAPADVFPDVENSRRSAGGFARLGVVKKANEWA